MTAGAGASQVLAMDIKLHPDAKKLLDELNSRRRGHIVKTVREGNEHLGLRRGTTKPGPGPKLRRADLDGRGGPL